MGQNPFTAVHVKKPQQFLLFSFFLNLYGSKISIDRNLFPGGSFTDSHVNMRALERVWCCLHQSLNKDHLCAELERPREAAGAGRADRQL